MQSTQDTDQMATLTAHNIGGIDETEVTFTPGVNVLVGRNATNRTSLLQALMTGLSSEQVSLKGDADEGGVELTIGNETYSRTLSRTNGSVSFNGDPYLGSDILDAAELFAFLLETNEARQAVAQQRDLREVIMHPVDTAAIQGQIHELEKEKQELDAELDELKARERKLPELEKQRTQLERQIEEKRKQLAEKETELEAADSEIDESKSDQSEHDAKLEELREARTMVEEVRLDIDTQEESVAALRKERDTVENELADVTEIPDGDIDSLEGKIKRIRDQKQAIDTTLNELQAVIQFNEEMLQGTSSDVAAALRDERGEEADPSVTDALLDENTQVICWTCGSEVDTEQIETTLERLRTLRQDKLSERNTLTNEIEELQTKQRNYEATKHERTQLQNRLTEIESEIESRKDKLTGLRQRRKNLHEEINQLEQTVEELETAENEELLALHKEANQLEFELGRLEGDREDIEAEIDAIETELDKQDQLTNQRTEVQAELQNLRSRVQQIETDAVTQFNEHMETILNILDYSNLERIWIERVEQEVREGRQKQLKSQFNLHIVRQTAEGATYEDTIDHLSESEREVTGLVFALAGYLVHDVYETLPFMLLDSLEAVDSERIARLVEYFHEYAPYLVIALLPEDAAALDNEYRRITSI